MAPGLPDVFVWTLGPYTDLLGGWFWAMLLFITVTAIYIRTRSIGPAYLFFVIGAAFFQAVLPGGPFDTLLFFAVVFGVVYTVYRVLVKRVRR